jgi:hypothetical protein
VRHFCGSLRHSLAALGLGRLLPGQEYLADPGLGLDLRQEPALDFLPMGALAGPGEHLHRLHYPLEAHIHLVRGSLQAQNGGILPLFE